MAEIDYASLIMLSGRHFLGNVLRDELRARNLPEQPGILVQTYFVARELIANGMGSCIIDEFTAASGRAPLRIRPLRPQIGFGIYLLHREGSVPSRPERAFVDIFREAIVSARQS